MVKTKRDFLSALKAFLVITVLTGMVYVFGVLGISQLCFPDQVNGRFQETGYGLMSTAVGQMDYRMDHLWGRPVDYQTIEQDGKIYVYGSLANDAYGSEETIQKQESLKAWIKENSLADSQTVPAELYTSSASGIDPEISLDCAMYQIPRLEQTTRIDARTLETIFKDHSSNVLANGPQEKTVNVIEVNLAIDDLIQFAD
ncbi:potassium-transporting ATPase subunit C [Erysipelotrichaceae bacterium 51-3]|uniref:potassium-transporting ATPase subunit C n=1 Tax=Allobaculum sp. JKK-2023 TaxID=3108943 RepID=UPI002B05647E|nr:potassium-transporting ATPase subunit C [Allobaculum sp. JKK-2023]